MPFSAGETPRPPPGLCNGATIVPVDAADSAWRAALEDLGAATRTRGRPWSCSGGSIELIAKPSGGAILVVVDARGEIVSRLVASPEEVVPTGEALLAAPVAAPPAPVAARVAAPVVVQPPMATPDAANREPASKDPRARFTLSVGPRVSGPGAIAWGSAQLDAVLPFGPWSLEFWGRYDLHLDGPVGPWHDLRMSAFSLGVAGGREILAHPFELRARITPSLGVVVMESGLEGAPTSPQGDKAAFRIGTGLNAVFPLSRVVRGMVALDGELAPAAVAGLRNIDTVNNPPQLPPVPSYTFGLLLGVEATLR